MTKERKKFQPLTSSDICEIYNLLHKEGVVYFPLTQDAVGKIEATIANINGSNFGVENYPGTSQKIVAYLYFLIKNHPFTDGNKRTAVLSFLVLARLNGCREKLNNYNLDELAVFLERHRTTNHHAFIKLVAQLLFG